LPTLSALHWSTAKRVERGPLVEADTAPIWLKPSLRTFLAEAGETGSLVGLKSLGLVQRQLMLDSTVTAYQDCFLLMTALCVAVMPLVFFIRRAPRRVL
jgi:hypothetical protein